MFEHKLLIIQGIKYQQTLFYKNKRIEVIYKRDLQSIANSKQEMCLYNMWWSQNLPPLLWRRAHTQCSVSWRWIGTTSIQKLPVLFLHVRNHPVFPDWTDSPVTFFLFLIPNKAYTKFKLFLFVYLFFCFLRQGFSV